MGGKKPKVAQRARGTFHGSFSTRQASGRLATGRPGGDLHDFIYLNDIWSRVGPGSVPQEQGYTTGFSAATPAIGNGVVDIMTSVRNSFSAGLNEEIESTGGGDLDWFGQVSLDTHAKPPSPLNSSFLEPAVEETVDEFSDSELVDLKLKELADALVGSMRSRLSLGSKPGYYGGIQGDANDELENLKARVQTLAAVVGHGKSGDGIKSRSLVDRLATVEGRQSSVQSSMAQLLNILGPGCRDIESRWEVRFHQLEEKCMQHMESASTKRSYGGTRGYDSNVVNDISTCAGEEAEGYCEHRAELHNMRSEISELHNRLQIQSKEIEELRDVVRTLGCLGPENDLATGLASYGSSPSESFRNPEKAHPAASAPEPAESNVDRCECKERVEAIEACLPHLEHALKGLQDIDPKRLGVEASVSQQTQALVSSAPSTWDKERDLVRSLQQQVQRLTQHIKQVQSAQKQADDRIEMHDFGLQADREQLQDIRDQVVNLKALIAKSMRTQQGASELLQEYVSTITHQVASVTRQYVSVLIAENNKSLETSLRQRSPDLEVGLRGPSSHLPFQELVVESIRYPSTAMDSLPSDGSVPVPHRPQSSADSKSTSRKYAKKSSTVLQPTTPVSKSREHHDKVSNGGVHSRSRSQTIGSEGSASH